MRDSQEKRTEKVTIQEEKRRLRLIEREKKHGDGKGKVDCITLSNISYLYNLPRCYSSSFCMLAEQAFTSTSSFTVPYHLSEQNSNYKGFCNA